MAYIWKVSISAESKLEDMKKIKIYYYTFELAEDARDLDAVIAELQDKPLEERIRRCGLTDVRLEAVERRRIGNAHQDVWLLRFSRLRDDNWPGVISTTEAARDLELDEDELLSEETSALIDPTNKRMTIQYNHFGVRASKVQGYLNTESGSVLGYQFFPVLNNEAMEKYRRKQIVTSLDATIDGINEADIALFEGSAIAQSVGQSIQARTTKMRFAFSVDARIKTNKIDRGLVDGLVARIMRRNGDNDRLEVKVKAEENDATETLQLLDALKLSEYNADEIGRTVGRRYDADDLNNILVQAHTEWLQSLP